MNNQIDKHNINKEYKTSLIVKLFLVYSWKQDFDNAIVFSVTVLQRNALWTGKLNYAREAPTQRRPQSSLAHNKTKESSVISATITLLKLALIKLLS